MHCLLISAALDVAPRDVAAAAYAPQSPALRADIVVGPS